MWNPKDCTVGNREENGGCQGLRGGGNGEMLVRVEAFTYKMNKFQGI